MSNYTPRPGSKTEAAINYIRDHGGSALATDIADEIDTDRKNLHAILGLAIEHGLLEAWDLPNGAGYCLCGSSALGTAVAKAKAKPTPAPPPAETRGEALARELHVTKAIPARRSRSMAQKPKVVAAKDLSKAKKPRRTKTTPPPHGHPRHALRHVQRWITEDRGGRQRSKGQVLRRGLERCRDHVHAGRGCCAH